MDLDGMSDQLVQKLVEEELILATALYQAKQKLSIIKKTEDNPIQSEELIKYSHNISSQHSVASPYNWTNGDIRRPYPTDIQMRQSLLNGNTPVVSDASPFHFIPTGLPGSASVNMDDKGVDIMSTDSSSSGDSSDSQ